MSVLAVDRVRAGARLEDHAGDGRLALAGRGVPSAGGKIDRRVGDRLGLLLGLLGASGGCLGLRFGRSLGLGVEELLALRDDVRDQVGTGDLRLDARRDLLVLVIVALA